MTDTRLHDLADQEVEALRAEVRRLREELARPLCDDLMALQRALGDEMAAHAETRAERDRLRGLAVQGWESARALAIAHVIPTNGKSSATERRADEVLSALTAADGRREE